MISKVEARYDGFDELKEKFQNGQFLNDAEENPILYSEDLAQVCYKRLCIIAEHDRELYGKGVQEYWSNKEDALIKEFPKVVSKASKLADKSLNDAIKYIDEWSNALQNETIEEAKTIFDQLI